MRTLLLLCAVFAWGQLTPSAHAEHTPVLGTNPDPDTLQPRPAVLRPEEPIGELVLRDAIAAALLGNPELAVVSWEARVREARTLQAGLLPNPELSVEVENWGGSGDRGAFEQTETTLWLSQLIELAGKRAKRKRVANTQHELAEWDYQSRRLTVLTATTQAFVATLAVQKRLELADELERLARASVSAVAGRFRAGAAPEVDQTRAEVVLLTAQLARDRLARELAASRTALAAMWGSAEPRFSAVRGDLTADVLAPPPLGELAARIGSNPDVARWESERAEREDRLALERARRIPDPTLGLGGRHFRDNGDNALVLQVSVPLPFFDWNQGNVLAATRDLHKAQAEQAAAELAVQTALSKRYEDLRAAFGEATTLRERTLPTAQRAFEGTRDGYRRGLFRYLDVLDAQRTLFELRTRELEALSTYHDARADIERLTAQPLYDREPKS